MKLITSLKHLVKIIILFLQTGINKLKQQPHQLRAFGSGKVEYGGMHYNVVFHMVYQLPKKTYTVQDIEREATMRFNLSKCRILNIANVGEDSILLSAQQAGSLSLSGVTTPHQDKIQYLMPAAV